MVSSKLSKMKEYVNPVNVKSVRSALENLEVIGDFLPTVYVIEPTNICNLKCVMCPNKNINTSDLGSMTLSVFERIIDSIAPYAEFVMLYWLGEPLLHPEISEMLYIARKKIKGKIVVSTNLTIATDEVLCGLLENTDIILCGLDRFKPNEYENIRVGANFSTVVTNIERLIKKKTQAHKAEIVVKGLDISFDSVEYQKFRDYWTQKGARPLLAWLNDWAGTFPSIRKVASIPIPQSHTKKACADLWYKMVINWRGEIQMCCFDWQYKNPIGVCHNPDWLKSVWQSEKIIYLRELHKKHEFTSIQLCKHCNTWGEISEHNAYLDFDDSSYFIVF